MDDVVYAKGWLVAATHPTTAAWHWSGQLHTVRSGRVQVRKFRAKKKKKKDKLWEIWWGNYHNLINWRIFVETLFHRRDGEEVAGQKQKTISDGEARRTSCSRIRTDYGRHKLTELWDGKHT